MPVSTLALLTTLAVVPPPTLPLQRVRLYETGVGYFERRGNVGASESLALPVPSSHIDDALKSLVVLEATTGVRIEGVQWGSSVSEGMARAMAGLPTDSEEPLAYDDLLVSLKGSRVQVQTDAGKIRGRFIDLEGPFFLEPAKPLPRAPNDLSQKALQGEPHYVLILLDEDDAVRRVTTDRVEAIRVLDEGTATRLDVAATALSDQNARQTAELRVQTSAPGRLGLGYISEAPVWRTTYRVVMESSGDQGQLQAWALVHNDSDEDWRAVSVELANGRPASFLHPLAAPRYAARELVAPPEDLSTVPQLANQTADSMWGDGYGEYWGVGGLGLVGHGGGGGGRGEGAIGSGLVGTIVGEAGGELGDLAELAQADGTESGALFLYRVADPIDLGAHHSALLPIVQQPIEVESITFFGVDDWDGLSAARIVNTTSQTLPPGVVSFFADGGFVGESVLDRLKPKERRFVAYGSELDVELDRERETLGEQVMWLRWNEETSAIEERYVLESEIRLHLENRSGRARRVYAALDVPRHSELRGDAGVQLDFDLATETPLVATLVEPGAAVDHELVAKSIEHRTHSRLGPATLRALLERPGLPQEQRELLATALEHARRRVELLGAAEANEAAMTELESDLTRLREDLSALGKARVRSRARNALTRELLDKEAEIDVRRAEAAELRDEAMKARQAKRAVLAKLAPPKATRVARSR
ncbi:hypothetical protein [Paraliomyxa miuraensis]|uniref:hypothetical protein n=1 Tax=Paraliomyxa miuraensis TaxID=376150 RepID=UPI00225948DB|nr:hypothetical protein [Paraliomyxa miuraensis]